MPMGISACWWTVTVGLWTLEERDMFRHTLIPALLMVVIQRNEVLGGNVLFTRAVPSTHPGTTLQML